MTEDINNQIAIEIGLNKRQDLCVQEIIKQMVYIPKKRIPKYGEIIEILSENYLIWKSFPELLTSSIETANSW